MTAPDSPSIPFPTPSEGARAILAAAEGLFAEKGYNAVSMNDIARVAGVSKSNIFHHFGNKNALYVAVLRAACSKESAELLQSLALESGPVIGRLQRFAIHHLESLLSNERTARLVQNEVRRSTDGKAKELAERLFGDNFACLLALVQTGQEQGELRSDTDPALIVVLLLSANLFYFDAHRVLRHLPGVHFADDPVAFSRMAVETLLRGIRPTP